MEKPLKFVGSPPPQRRRRRSQWDEAAKALREHPGEWVELVSYEKASQARSLAHHINQSRGPWDGRWEAASRTQDDGRTYVYVCYVGTDDEQEHE